MTQVVDLTRDPDRGEEVRGALALWLMRDWIDRTNASGDPEQIKEVHIFDALLSRSDAPAKTEGQDVAAPAPGHDFEAD